jgi:hypothetical protein
MTIARPLARCAMALVLSAGLAGCAYEPASGGWGEPYAASDIYGYPYDDGIYEPGLFVGGFHHRFSDHRAQFGHAFHHGGFFHPHFGGGMHIAHVGGFGGHGRG